MDISRLPEDCLITIFQFIHDLDDVVSCYQVNSKWRYLIFRYRLSEVKYVVHFDSQNFWGKKPKTSLDSLYFTTRARLSARDIAPLLPNLRMISLVDPFPTKLALADMCKFLADAKNLRGVIYTEWLFQGKIIDKCNNIEMYAGDTPRPLLRKKGASLKVEQLHLWNYKLDNFVYDAKYFPNLVRLNIYNDDMSPDDLYRGPILKKLKILELSLASYDGEDDFYGFEFLNFCPQLESAHIWVKSNRHIISSRQVNHNMRDLVLAYGRGCEQSWGSLKLLLKRYPNLKHLSLRDNEVINDYHVKELFEILPKLSLVDLRGSPGVTSISLNLVNEIKKRQKRDIFLYCRANSGQLKVDWPDFETTYEYFVIGMDFMKHCFAKRFKDLPYLMDARIM